MGTSGSEGGQQKPTSRKADRAQLADPTRSTPPAQGKLYLCAIKDVFSNRIVGYSISDRMKAWIAVDALNMAVSRRGIVAGCIVHSDRGSQFRGLRQPHARVRTGIGDRGRQTSPRGIE